MVAKPKLLLILLLINGRRGTGHSGQPSIRLSPGLQMQGGMSVMSESGDA